MLCFFIVDTDDISVFQCAIFTSSSFYLQDLVSAFVHYEVDCTHIWMFIFWSFWSWEGRLDWENLLRLGMMRRRSKGRYVKLNRLKYSIWNTICPSCQTDITDFCCSIQSLNMLLLYFLHVIIIVCSSWTRHWKPGWTLKNSLSSLRKSMRYWDLCELVHCFIVL